MRVVQGEERGIRKRVNCTDWRAAVAQTITDGDTTKQAESPMGIDSPQLVQTLPQWVARRPNEAATGLQVLVRESFGLT
jgi:hypothetical protein